MSFLGSREIQGSLSAWYFPGVPESPHISLAHYLIASQNSSGYTGRSCVCSGDKSKEKKNPQPTAKRRRSRGNPLHWCDWITQPLQLTSGKQKKNKLLIQTSELIYRRSNPLPWHLYSDKAGFLSGLFASLAKSGHPTAGPLLFALSSFFVTVWQLFCHCSLQLFRWAVLIYISSPSLCIFFSRSRN